MFSLVYKVILVSRAQQGHETQPNDAITPLTQTPHGITACVPFPSLTLPPRPSGNHLFGLFPRVWFFSVYTLVKSYGVGLSLSNLLR